MTIELWRINLTRLAYLILISFLAETSAWAQSPYLQVYMSQLQADKLEVDAAQFQVKLEKRNLERLKSLLEDGIISELQVDQQQVKVDEALLEVANLEAVSSQSESLFELTKLRIESGLEVSVCSEN